MTEEHKIAPRLQFLARVVRKECQHLTTTDQRLFGGVFTIEQAIQLETDHDLAERVEAFVGRFGRLQDTVGDKLLLLLLDVTKPRREELVAAIPSPACGRGAGRGSGGQPARG